MDFIDFDVPFFHFYLVDSKKSTEYSRENRVQRMGFNENRL